MSVSKSNLQLDHLVYVLPTAEFEHPPAWLADRFTIITGGTHADGCSRNKLIIFKDGTYIELLDWIDKQGTAFQDWVDRGNGWIDFALTSGQDSARAVYERISKNLQQKEESTDIGAPGAVRSGFAYAEPKAGGRKKPDGIEIQWETFRPNQPLAVPFFCHDVTERTLRVPHQDDRITTHPCGAIGISQIELCVDAKGSDMYTVMYEAVLDVMPQQGKDKTMVYPIESPSQTEGIQTEILLSTKNSDEKAGICSVTVLASDGTNFMSIRL